jgi:hypothetical protein
MEVGVVRWFMVVWVVRDAARLRIRQGYGRSARVIKGFLPPDPG